MQENIVYKVVDNTYIVCNTVDNQVGGKNNGS